MNAGGKAAEGVSRSPISDKQQHALFVAAYMVTDIVWGEAQKRRFLMDVCLAFTTAVLNEQYNADLRYNPESDWAKEWGRRTGILPDGDVSDVEMDDYIDELEDLKPIPESAVSQARAELRQAEEQLERTKQEIVDLIGQIHIIGR